MRQAHLAKMHEAQGEYTYAMQNAWGDKELSSINESSLGGHTNQEAPKISIVYDRKDTN
jgi:hypothetical protein